MIGCFAVVEPTASDARLERAPGALWRRVLDGVLVLAPGDEVPMHITTPGDVVWEMLGAPVTVGELVHRLAEIYAEPVERVRADIEPLVGTLLAAGAIRESPARI